jgi:hypothetical protein
MQAGQRGRRSQGCQQLSRVWVGDGLLGLRRWSSHHMPRFFPHPPGEGELFAASAEEPPSAAVAAGFAHRLRFFDDEGLFDALMLD